MPFGGLRASTAAASSKSVEKESSRVSRSDSPVRSSKKDPSPVRSSRRDPSPIVSKTTSRRDPSPMSRRREETPPKRERTPLRTKRDPSPPPQRTRRATSPSPKKTVHADCDRKIQELEQKLNESEERYDELYVQMGEWEAILKDPLEYSKVYEADMQQTIYDVLDDKFIKHLQNTGKWPSIRSSPSLTRSSGVSASVKPYESRYARVPSSMIMRTNV